jgi:signal transduction histidine kinase
MEDKERLLRRIISKAHSATAMIDEYLTMFAIGAGEMELVCEKVNLRQEVIQRAMDNQREAMAKRGMSAGIDIPGNLEVVCDPRYIQIVYNNLVNNAAKYGTENSQIYIDYVTSQDGDHQFSVASAGGWIGEGDRERIFEKYVHLEASGTGIGLHTTREIIEAHGGNIRVVPCYFDGGKCIPADPEREGTLAADLLTGNNFVFTLPACDDVI